jgi:post-segregation antitoxin (ccd killing protein)
MNTAIGYTRVNLTIPKDIIEYLKHNTENMSKYISEAVKERIAREKRQKALSEILAEKPTFTDVKDGTTYVRELRSVDKTRDKRLGLI